MGSETGKAVARRSMDHRWATRYLVGRGVDIGAGNDSLAYYAHMFPLITEVVSWDKEQGDAQLMAGVEDESFDFVNSSHCLEHLDHPYTALENWIRLVKPGGHLAVIVPDYRLYEHGVWPSVRNPDHKWRFSINGHNGILNLLDDLDGVDVLKIELLDRGFRYGIDEMRFDQSALVCCEPAIEFVLRKL